MFSQDPAGLGFNGNTFFGLILFNALHGVLADLKQVAPDVILHGGDLVFGGTHPAEIIDQSFAKSQRWRNVSLLQEQYPRSIGQRIGRYMEFNAPMTQVRQENLHHPIKS